MTIQLNDQATLKTMSAVGFELLFEGNLREAKTVFSAVYAMQPEQRAAAVGLAFTSLEASLTSVENSRQKELETMPPLLLSNSDPILLCLRALAELQRNDTELAQKMLREVVLGSDPVARQLAVKIMENELRGIV